MRLYLFLSLSLLCGYTQAAIYKWESPDGTVIFSDQPHPDAEKIATPKAQTYTPPSKPEFITPEISSPKESAVNYTNVMISAPANDATIRENTGRVEIKVSIEPPLQTQAGHKILLKMDGRIIGGPTTEQQYILDNVDRGTHILQASIVDASGNTLINSTSITFHLKRTSILLRNKPADGG
jgi:hypothetical protein